MSFLVMASVRAHWRRFALVALGLGLSYAAILFTYALAANVQISSNAALDYVVGDASIWVTGPSMPAIDRETRGLTQASHIRPDVAARLLRRARGSLAPISVERFSWGGTPLTVYWDGRREAALGAAISRDLSEAVGAAPPPTAIAGVWSAPAEVRRELPGLTLVLPYAWRSGAPDLGPTWLVGSPPSAWGREAAAAEGFSLRDDLSSSGLGTGVGTVFLLKSSLSRFDPFSFGTKFSALQLSGIASSLLGWLARLIFVLGGVFAISSLMMSVEERRPEIAALAALGYEPEFTQMVLIEATLLFLASIPIGFAVAGALSMLALPAGEVGASLGAGFGLTIFFTVFVLVVGTLLTGQSVARRPVVELVRGSSE